MTDTIKDSSSTLDAIKDWLGGLFSDAHGEPDYPKLKGETVREEYCAIEGTGFYHCMGTSKDNPVPHEVPQDFTRGLRR